MHELVVPTFLSGILPVSTVHGLCMLINVLIDNLHNHNCLSLKTTCMVKLTACMDMHREKGHVCACMRACAVQIVTVNAVLDALATHSYIYIYAVGL